MNKLSRKDIKLLRTLANTPEKESKLNEYIAAKGKADKLWKEFRELVVNEQEVKPKNKERKFKKGDKVRVVSTDYDDATTNLSAGDITVVLGYKEDDIKRDWYNPEFMTVMVADKRKNLGRGYFEESALELVEEKTPNELRKEIIEKAKEFVEENSIKKEDASRDNYVSVCYFFQTYIEFVVNIEKRTVVALAKGIDTDFVRSKGIAKCHPDDVFNEHIGKAIALGRALGKDVSEFENAVQPDEIVVGHSISSTRKDGSYYEYPSVTDVETDKVWGVDSVREYHTYTPIRSTYEGLATRPKIIDDTNARYGGIE